MVPPLLPYQKFFIMSSYQKAVRTICVLLIAGLAPFNVQAQDGTYSTGWIMFNDSVAPELELRTAQLERLREIDRRYHDDYVALGATPRSNSNYLPLTERRNSDIQAVLDQEQFEQWMRMNDYDHTNSQRRAEPGPQSTGMDRRDPQGDHFERDSRSNVNDRNNTPKSGGINTP